MTTCTVAPMFTLETSAKDLTPAFRAARRIIAEVRGTDRPWEDRDPSGTHVIGVGHWRLFTGRTAVDIITDTL